MSPSNETDTGTETGADTGIDTEIAADTDVRRSLLTYGLLVALLLASGLYYAFVV